tara:strand:- start:560 stop:877 length:318 start_codon:yes stop_codon:yes gene_type:complete
MITDESFPIWKPQRATLSNIVSSNIKTSYKSFRNSSSGFVAKKTVRDYIFSKYDYKCNNCGSDESLQIDHIESVYSKCNKRDFYKCNIESNLQALCEKCNTSKKP